MRSSFEKKLIFLAIWGAFKKCNPFYLWRNPVIFITEIGAIVTTIQWIKVESDLHFYIQISIWLWLTVLFANFAEAIAEERNQAHAVALRKKRKEILARVKQQDGSFVALSGKKLKKGDIVLVLEGEIIPGDGEIIEGMASIDESSITGESAPVIRAAGTDRTSVTGGTKVLSDKIMVRISSDAGESFLDRMIDLIESARRKKSSNEIALTILLSGFTFIFLIVVSTLEIFGKYYQLNFSATMLVALLICLIPTTIGGLLSAIGIAGINRLMKKNVLALSGQAVEAAGDIDIILIDKTGTITLGNRCASEMKLAVGIDLKELLSAAYFTSLNDETTEGRSILEFLEKNYQKLPEKPKDFHFIPFSAATKMSGMDIEGEKYRKGSTDAIEAFLNSPLPKDVEACAKAYAEKGGTPIVLCNAKAVLGVILLKDIVKTGLKQLFHRFRGMGIKTVMITGDNPITAEAIAKEAGVDHFIAKVTPEQKLKIVQEAQQDGQMVGMTGDGVNDAPALAQADVGVAMQSGAQEAKEAGNMIDLDSNPSKLFEIIEIGKQMLMTRGALTTFSIANDISKYFVILPAILMPYFPAVTVLNVMRLKNFHSAILSAVIFNALIIPILIPLAMKGVKMIPKGAIFVLRRNLTIYGLGGVILPFIGIKLIDMFIGLWL